MTVAIYQQTANGMYRVGTFTPRKYYSVKAISEQFCKRHPNCNPADHFIARRSNIMGRWVDGELIPFEESNKA